MVTNKQWIEMEINGLDSQIRNYDRDLKYAIEDYGSAEKITPLCSDTNLANMTAMASEIKCRKFAREILQRLLVTIKD